MKTKPSKNSFVSSILEFLSNSKNILIQFQEVRKVIQVLEIFKKYFRVEFNYEKFQEITPTLLEQHTKNQTLIQGQIAVKTPQKFYKVQVR